MYQCLITTALTLKCFFFTSLTYNHVQNKVFLHHNLLYLIYIKSGVNNKAMIKNKGYT